MDIRELKFEANTFDVAIDKGSPLSILVNKAVWANRRARNHGRDDDSKS